MFIKIRKWKSKISACYKLLVSSPKLVELVKSPNLYCADGFATTNFIGFKSDLRFNEVFSKSLIGIPEKYSTRLAEIEWRAHIVNWAASQALSVEGDFVELGVWYGVLSKNICDQHNFGLKDRNFYLVDSWGSKGSLVGYEEDIYLNVCDRFYEYPNVKLIRGLVPQILHEIKLSKIAYLSIDMNNAEAEISALEYLYDKVVTGGVIYIDDYGWNHPKLRIGVDAFFKNKQESLLHFPSGNAVVIKI